METGGKRRAWEEREGEDEGDGREKEGLAGEGRRGGQRVYRKNR